METDIRCGSTLTLEPSLLHLDFNEVTLALSDGEFNLGPQSYPVGAEYLVLDNYQHQ